MRSKLSHRADKSCSDTVEEQKASFANMNQMLLGRVQCSNKKGFKKTKNQAH